jgi:two-component system, sporulation sensor kinase B
MREFQQGIQKRNYYIIVSIIIVLMAMGVVIDNLVNERFFIHGAMVVIVSVSLLLTLCMKLLG